MSSDDDEDFLSWDMLDDRKFVMRPGYKFPSAMSYKEMCQQVNNMKFKRLVLMRCGTRSGKLRLLVPWSRRAGFC